MSFFEFPHTRTYDSDLGWLIKEYEKIASDYDSLEEFIDAYPTEYAALTNRIIAVENSMNSFQTQMDERFNRLQRELENDINVELNLALNLIHKELNEALAQINTSLGNIRSNISDLNAKIIRTQISLEGRIVATEDYCTLYTDVKIQELIDSLPDLRTINVFNPVVGRVTDIQTAIYDIYDLSRYDGLRALEYDTLGLTASEYDALDLTALQYDQMGRYYLELAGIIKNPYHYMTSPFTGEYVTLETVITELAALHKLYALTADEYDLKELTASDYDALLLGAYDYDWHGKQLIA